MPHQISSPELYLFGGRVGKPMIPAFDILSDTTQISSAIVHLLGDHWGVAVVLPQGAPLVFDCSPYTLRTQQGLRQCKICHRKSARAAGTPVPV